MISEESLPGNGFPVAHHIDVSHGWVMFRCFQRCVNEIIDIDRVAEAGPSIDEYHLA